MINTVDFETEGIEKRPKYPPKPVGVSIWHAEAEEPIYLAWGHPSENNCTWEDARKQLAAIWDGEMLYHNGRFDTEVAHKWMDLPRPRDPLKVHDTLFLNYLYDAQAESLSLKPSAQRILGIAPTEQADLERYLATKGYAGKGWGAHISKAPGGIVGEYAKGDTFRTRQLYEYLLDKINKAGMLEAYRREQRLAPILNQNEEDGIRINMSRLVGDLEKYELVYKQVTLRLLNMIGLCNPDSAIELGAALIKSGRAKMEDFKKTPTGKISTAKASMDLAVKDPELRGILAYRGNLKTLLTTFMRPWAEMATSNSGRVHPEFNQVRGDVYGTRTGRLSSSNPNFQNIPTEFKSEAAPPDLPPLPQMRCYVLPDEGHLLASSDFNGQEMRIAAHFAEGRAADIYRTDPSADFHQAVAEIIERDAGLKLDRKMVKITGFSLIYGSGINSLAELLGVDNNTATKIRYHYFQALPGFKELMDDVSARGRKGLPVKTWGGRLIYAEKAKLVNGQQWTFDYKLLNYLIQGSAADQTKEAINTAGYGNNNRRFLCTVHDENVYSVNPEHLDDEIREIKASMETQVGWDVPFKAEVKVGANWADLAKYAG
jgi:DNA polymerase I-like protein with 3'-5' exonuclease and polymerase domains